MVSERCQEGNRWHQEGVIGYQEDIRYQVSVLWINFLLPSGKIPCFFIGYSWYLECFGTFFSMYVVCYLCCVFCCTISDFYTSQIKAGR